MIAGTFSAMKLSRRPAEMRRNASISRLEPLTGPSSIVIATLRRRAGGCAKAPRESDHAAIATADRINIARRLIRLPSSLIVMSAFLSGYRANQDFWRHESTQHEFVLCASVVNFGFLAQLSSDACAL